jgi:hypothetical protein
MRPSTERGAKRGIVIDAGFQHTQPISRKADIPRQVGTFPGATTAKETMP